MNWSTTGILIIFAAFVLLLILNPNMSCFGRRIKSPFYPLFRKEEGSRKRPRRRLRKPKIMDSIRPVDRGRILLAAGPPDRLRRLAACVRRPPRARPPVRRRRGRRGVRLGLDRRRGRGDQGEVRLRLPPAGARPGRSRSTRSAGRPSSSSSARTGPGSSCRGKRPTPRTRPEIMMERFLGVSLLPDEAVRLLSGTWRPTGRRRGERLERGDRTTEGRVGRGARGGFAFAVREFFPGDGVPREIGLGAGDVRADEGPQARLQPAAAGGGLRRRLPPRLRPEDVGRDPGAPGQMTVKSFAKINLGLEIVGKRPDGYHDIRTLFQTISLADELDFEPAPDGVLQLDGDDPAVAWDETNLVHRAARLLQGETGTAKGARITVRKSVPAGRGLGGGSSNAAATLLALNRHVGPRPGARRAGPPGPGPGSRCPLFSERGALPGRGHRGPPDPPARPRPSPLPPRLPAVPHPDGVHLRRRRGRP